MTRRFKALLIAVALAGCAHSAGSTSTATTAGPEHRSIEIALDHAPDPARYLPEDEAVYLAWLRPDGTDTYLRAGPLYYDAAADQARLVVDVPSDQFAIVVTAETSPRADAPNGVVVMHVECDVNTTQMPPTPSAHDVAAPGETLASEVSCEAAQGPLDRASTRE